MLEIQIRHCRSGSLRPHDDIVGVDGRLLDELTTIVSAAAASILAARAGSLEVRAKADLSPVTAADHAAEALILEGLARPLPGMCVVSEEAAGCAPPDCIPGSFVLVDPLDGTRELLAGRDEFTINVALVSGGAPRLGIIAAPAGGGLWRGGVGARRRRGGSCGGGLWGAAPSGCFLRPERRRVPRTSAAPFEVGLRRARASLRWSAARISNRRPRRSWHDCRSRTGARADRRSNSARSPKDPPTSIHASPPLANGTRRSGTRWLRPPAAPSSRRRGRR